MHLTQISFLLPLLFLTLTTVSNADPLIDSCDECHGKNGVSTVPKIPTIAGISSFALELSLEAYTDGSRQARAYDNQDMKSIVEKLSADEISSLAAHYASQTFTAAAQTIDKTKAEKGKTLHNNQCEICHSENGSLADDDSSILAGQWKEYILEELNQYKSNTRKGPKKMAKAISALSDEDIEALAEFYASQQ